MMPITKYNWIELSEELNLNTVFPESFNGGINLTFHGENYKKIRAKLREWKNSELADCLTRYGDCFFSYVDKNTRSDGTIRVFRTDIGSRYLEAGMFGKVTRKIFFDQIKKLHVQGANPVTIFRDEGIKNFFYPQIGERYISSVVGYPQHS